MNRPNVLVMIELLSEDETGQLPCDLFFFFLAFHAFNSTMTETLLL